MGPTTGSNSISKSHYNRLRKKKALYTAWRKVYDNGIHSKSKETRELVKEYNANILWNIEAIYRKLLNNNYKFKLSRGVPKRRKGKKPRPIVVSPLESRIVQRSILDVLQNDRTVSKYVSTPYSFGGIKDPDTFKSVSGAITELQKAISGGAKWYFKSDIKDFFTYIPKKRILEQMSDLVPDTSFNELFAAAVEVELENMEILGNQTNLFPLHEIGVAQGCCLSPFIGNLLLHDFDESMNQRGVVCLRYIDDFIILSSTSKKVNAASRSALQMLQSLGLSAYDPLQGDQKGKMGSVSEGIGFLGCEIKDGIVRPDTNSLNRLLSTIEGICKDSMSQMRSPKNCFCEKKTVVDTLHSIHNHLLGWGNQYFYCNDEALIRRIDKRIDELLKEYLSFYGTQIRALKPSDYINRRRLLGVFILLEGYYKAHSLN
jgi:hypothetical protein